MSIQGMNISVGVPIQTAPPKLRGQTKPPTPVVRWDTSILTKQDLYLFNEGTHCRLYNRLGAHPRTMDGVAGTFFAVWAPGAEQVAVMGDFNGWSNSSHQLRPCEQSGIWDAFIPGIGHGACYKYHVVSRYNSYRTDRTDPFTFFQEVPPRTASIVWDLHNAWGDQDWLSKRRS